MAITDNGNELVMPVAPMYGGGNGNNNVGFGGDWGWIVLLLLLAGNGGWGFGGGFGGGFGNMMLGYDFPWLLNGQNGINSNVNEGFQNLATQNQLTAVQSDLGDIQTQLCNGFAGVNATINSTAANAETAANARAMANMQQLYGLSSQFADCCCDNKLGIADLKYTVATENCADRQALNEGVRDIIASQTAGTQRILDQLCADKIDAKNDEIAQLRQEVLYARGQASQIAQNEQIVNSIYNRLDQCPVSTTPVYGRQPIFTCPQTNNCGCGCGNNF